MKQSVKCQGAIFRPPTRTHGVAKIASLAVTLKEKVIFMVTLKRTWQKSIDRAPFSTQR
jgi:hypothetical protein